VTDDASLAYAVFVRCGRSELGFRIGGQRPWFCLVDVAFLEPLERKSNSLGNPLPLHDAVILPPLLVLLYCSWQSGCSVKSWWLRSCNCVFSVLCVGWCGLSWFPTFCVSWARRTFETFHGPAHFANGKPGSVHRCLFCTCRLGCHSVGPLWQQLPDTGIT
jgi:hypothetical protein